MGNSTRTGPRPTRAATARYGSHTPGGSGCNTGGGFEAVRGVTQNPYARLSPTSPCEEPFHERKLDIERVRAGASLPHPGAPKTRAADAASIRPSLLLLQSGWRR